MSIPQSLLVALCQLREDFVGALRGAPTSVIEPGVLADADHETEVLPAQPREELLADELAIGYEGLDTPRLDQRQNAFHERDAFFLVRSARLIEFLPDKRHGDARLEVAHDEQVKRPCAEVPLGAVHDEHAWLLAHAQGEQQLGERLEIETEAGKEALQAAVIGIGRALGMQRAGEHRQVNRAQAQHGQHEGAEREEPCAVPREMRLQNRHERVNVRHGTGWTTMHLGSGNHKVAFARNSVPTSF